ncbi:hypothetical protein [Leucobacter soli]
MALGVGIDHEFEGGGGDWRTRIETGRIASATCSRARRAAGARSDW